VSGDHFSKTALARRDPEEKRTARLRLAGQKFFRLGKCLPVVQIMNLAAFGESERRRLAEVDFPESAMW
jgi:hypothetical protein